jgi:hypothetical protein
MRASKTAQMQEDRCGKIICNKILAGEILGVEQWLILTSRLSLDFLNF